MCAKASHYSMGVAVSQDTTADVAALAAARASTPPTGWNNHLPRIGFAATIRAMSLDKTYHALTLPTKAKLVLLVLDGLGDIATARTNFRTPLSAARTPNLDALAKVSALGRILPVAPGITPGSGPAHLALFGYDPLTVEVGRGVIEALGLGIDLKAGDVAARANFCTLNERGIITDRRAGRIPTEVCRAQCKLLSDAIQKIDGATVLIRPGESHRFVVVFRGSGLAGPVSDSDPHHEGEPIQGVRPLGKGTGAKKTAALIKKFYAKALPVLRGRTPANGFLLRGIDGLPKMESFTQRYGLCGASLAIYPMYKGLAQLVGMAQLEAGKTVLDQFAALAAARDRFDYFFIHVKGTDMAGEDGNFEKKVAVIEEVDAALPKLLALKPDVLAITGDHSTPVPMKGHSWHPVPLLLHSEVSNADGLESFTEVTARTGSLGTFESKYLLRLMQANARMFDKFGA